VINRFVEEGIADHYEFWGIDLVDMFDPLKEKSHNLNLISIPLDHFETDLRSDDL